VVEIAGFDERTFLDAAGAPHTDELRTVERIRRIGPRELEDGSKPMSAASRTATSPRRPGCAARKDPRPNDATCVSRRGSGT